MRLVLGRTDVVSIRRAFKSHEKRTDTTTSTKEEGKKLSRYFPRTRTRQIHVTPTFMGNQANVALCSHVSLGDTDKEGQTNDCHPRLHFGSCLETRSGHSLTSWPRACSAIIPTDRIIFKSCGRLPYQTTRE